MSYPHMLHEGGIVIVWETAALSIPGDGGKTAQQKDLKSFLNRTYLYAKEIFNWPKKRYVFCL